MATTQEEEQAYSIWIDHTDKIISFRSAEGFERMDFSSQEARLSYAFEKCSSGYRIQ